MRSLTTQEIDTLAENYICFRDVAKKYQSPPIIAAFKNYEEHCVKKLGRLVDQKVRKYKKFSNYIDLRQDGLEALLLAFNTFDPKKGSFAWWADKYISTRIYRAANAHSTIRYPIEKAKKFMPYKTNCIPVIVDSTQNPAEKVESRQNSHYIKKAIESLPPQHQMVINMTFGCNGIRIQPAKHVIDMLNISRSRYVKLLKEAKSKIREYMIKLG